jgi:purine-binding chemotaxis protein CheW
LKPVSRSALHEAFFYRPDEEVGALDQLQAEASEQPGPIAAEEPEEFLAFGLENETYAVAIGEVREIVKVPLLTEVPRGQRGLLGVMNLRGEVLPVYDVKHRLGLIDAVPVVSGPQDLPRAARVVLMRDEQGDAGVLVDRVNEVVKLLPSRFEAPPPGTSDREAIAGLARKGDALYILLDVTRVLS